MRQPPSLLILSLTSLALSCIVQTEPGANGPKGDRGDRGDKGPIGQPGTPDNSALQTLQAQIDALQKRTVDPECPVGYEPIATPPPEFLTDSVSCSRGADEVVKVGVGGSAFWIDRYEASVWTTPDGPVGGVQRFALQDDTDPVTFPKNGQFTVPHYALSVAGVQAAGNITWLQASETCAANGKRLPTGQEWLRAARGTLDPGIPNNGGGNRRCNTNSPDARTTGEALGGTMALSCVSVWGAEDMIGNKAEWTDEWHAGLYDGAGYGVYKNWPDPQNGTLNGDGVSNVASYSYTAGPGWVTGAAVVAVRGGYHKDGVQAGAFTINLDNSPVNWGLGLGFRCAVPR